MKTSRHLATASLILLSLAATPLADARPSPQEMCDDGSAQAPGLANAHDSNDSRAGVFVCAPGVAGVSVQPARDPNHVDLITGYAFIITVDGESGTPLPDQCEIKLITHGQGGPSATPTGCN